MRVKKERGNTINQEPISLLSDDNRAVKTEAIVKREPIDLTLECENPRTRVKREPKKRDVLEPLEDVAPQLRQSRRSNRIRPANLYVDAETEEDYEAPLPIKSTTHLTFVSFLAAVKREFFEVELENGETMMKLKRRVRPGKMCARLPPEIWIKIVSFTRDYVGMTSLTTVCAMTRQILSVSDKPWAVALDSFFATRWKPYSCEKELRERVGTIGARGVLRILFDLKCTGCRAAKSQIFWELRCRYCENCAKKRGLAVYVPEVYVARWYTSDEGYGYGSDGGMNSAGSCG